MVSFFRLTGCSFLSTTRIRDTPPSCSDSCGSNRNPRRYRSSCNHHIGVLACHHERWYRSSCNHHIGVLSCHLCRLHIGSSLFHILDHLGPTDSPPSGESQQPHVSNGIGCKQQQQIIDESTPALNNRMCCQQHQLIVICIILYDWIQEVFNIILHGLVYIREVIKSAFEPQNADGCVSNSWPWCWG